MLLIFATSVDPFVKAMLCFDLEITGVEESSGAFCPLGFSSVSLNAVDLDWGRGVSELRVGSKVARAQLRGSASSWRLRSRLYF